MKYITPIAVASIFLLFGCTNSPIRQLTCTGKDGSPSVWTFNINTGESLSYSDFYEKLVVDKAEDFGEGGILKSTIVGNIYKWKFTSPPMKILGETEPSVEVYEFNLKTLERQSKISISEVPIPIETCQWTTPKTTEVHREN